MTRKTLTLHGRGNKPDPHEATTLDEKHRAARQRTDVDRMHAEARELIDTAKAEDRDLSQAESDQVEALMDRVEELTGPPPGSNRVTRPHDPNPHVSRQRGGGATWVEAMHDRNAVNGMDTGGFSGFGEFLSAVSDTARGKYDERLGPLDLRSQQSVGVGTEGGYAVPERFSAELLMTAADEAPFLAMRDVETITGAGTGLVRPKVDDRDRSSEEYGGIAMQRVGENTTLSGDSVVFGSEELRLAKAAALVRVSNELMTDNAIGMDRSLRRVFGRAVQQRQSLDFLAGSGAGEPLGFLNSGALLTATRDSSNQVALSDVAEMVAKLLPGSQSRAVWLAHPSVAEWIIQLSDSASRNVFVGQNAGQSAPTTLLGRPLFYTSAAPALGTQGDLSLVDPMAYLYVHRPLAIDVSRDADFDSDQTTFRCVLRDDGHPSYDSSLTDEQSQSLSEFIALAA